MSRDAFHQLYYHFVWSTKDRQSQIKDTLIQFVEHVIAEDARKRHASVIACGAMTDHVHLLVGLPPEEAPATFVGRVKGASAHELNKTTGQKTVTWQVGYGVLSLRKADVDRVARYVNNQPAIHASRKKESILECTAPVES